MNVIRSYKFRRILEFQHPSQLAFRRLNNTVQLGVELLTKRSIIQIIGDDVSDFLQGLITNNMTCFSDGAVSLYALFLNNKGRVLFDTVIYSCSKSNSFLLECDSACVSSLIKHLTLYKVKRKLQINSLQNDLCVWSVYNSEKINNLFSLSKTDNDIEGLNKIYNNELSILKSSEDPIIVEDPRIADLGYRVIARKDKDVVSLFNGINSNDYAKNRYKLGIPEGSEEITKGHSFPLEINADYLNGVSFDKGCYIGQELTARTHHTGVVRKRLMPLLFERNPAGIPVHSPIEDVTMNRKTPIGKLISYKDTYGLGLMRVKETLESKSLKVLDLLCTSHQPFWWPKFSNKYYSKV